MQYGVSIVPKTFFDTKPQFFTKQAFANYLARALQSVGMIPLLTVNSYDLADPAMAEYDPGGHSNNGFFWFDYPTDETYTINGVTYRPCLGLGNMVYRAWTNNNTSIGSRGVGYYVGSNVGVKPYRRRADRVSRGDFKCYENLTGGQTINYGFGSLDEAASTYWGQTGGSITGFAEWKLFATWGDSNMQKMLFVNRVFIHLGKAGLIVQIGTHPTRRDETCNIMNFGAVFQGGRIPNRARPVQDDVLRDASDPIAWFDFGGYANTLYANQTRASMYTALLGASRLFDGVLGGFDASVYAYLKSIDYLDDGSVANAPVDNYARPSPTVLNGVGVHMLHRACLIPEYQTNDSSKTAGRIDSVKQPNLNGVYKWADTFYLPGFALSDRVAPPGPRVDPVTGKNWYMIWSTARGQAFGLDYDGVTTLPALTAGADASTLEQTIPLDVTSMAEADPPYSRVTPRTGGDAWKAGKPRTLLGTFGGISVYIAQFDMGGGRDADPSHRWRKVASENGFTLPQWGYASWDGPCYSDLVLELEGLPTDPRDRWYVEYQYRARTPSAPTGDPLNSDYSYHYLYAASGLLTTGTAAGNTRGINKQRIGSTAQQNIYYNYQTYGVKGALYPVGVPTAPIDVSCFTPDSSGKAVLVFDANETSSYGNIDSYGTAYAVTYDIRNIVLKRYRRA